MHGSQSRAQTLFEAFCALAISASFAGAWMQTGASALLAAAAVAALFGIIHAFDGGSSHPVEVPSPESRALAPLDQGNASPASSTPGKSALVEAMDVREPVEEADAVAPAPPKAPKKSRAKARRKSVDARDRAEQTNVTEIGLLKEAEIDPPTPLVEEAHPPIEPLFEPEPFVRMQRPAFGRKAG